MLKPGKIQIVKYVPPPPELPIYGQVDPAEVSFIGRTNYAAALEEKRFVFGIKREDRRRHLYMVGRSGVGKSKLLELLIRQDIAYGHGVCLIDPHGDTIDAILDFVPENRIDDVVLIDPTDMDHPVSFNPLQNVGPGFKHQFAQGLIEAIEKQFVANWTPQLEHLFRFAVLALLDYPHATMRSMISLLTNHRYREKVVAHIEDDMVKRFWMEKLDTDAVVPLVNKLGQFLSDPLLRNIFGQKETKIDFEKLINQKKLILVNLSKGRLGEGNSSFLGAILVAKLKEAGMARAAMPEKERHEFYFYMDEFHAFVTESFENILSEARKYGICLTVAHQYMSQLSPRVQAAVLGNVGSIIIFRVGGEDAVRLKPEMAPVFDAKDMINLGTQEFYIKMTIDGEPCDPFSAETLKVLPPPHPSFRTEIIDRSRGNYTISADAARKLVQAEDGANEGIDKAPNPLI